MTRPIYESDGDRAAESKLSFVFSSAMGVEAVKTKQFFPVDYALQDRNTGVVTGLVECKIRKIPSTKFSDYMVSMHKWHALVSYDEMLNLPCFLVVQWTDRIGIVRPARSDPQGVVYRIGGRYDRGDASDVEPVVHYPISLFRDLAEWQSHNAA